MKSIVKCLALVAVLSGMGCTKKDEGGGGAPAAPAVHPSNQVGVSSWDRLNGYWRLDSIGNAGLDQNRDIRMMGQDGQVELMQVLVRIDGNNVHVASWKLNSEKETTQNEVVNLARKDNRLELMAPWNLGRSPTDEWGMPADHYDMQYSVESFEVITLNESAMVWKTAQGFQVKWSRVGEREMLQFYETLPTTTLMHKPRHNEDRFVQSFADLRGVWHLSALHGKRANEYGEVQIGKWATTKYLKVGARSVKVYEARARLDRDGEVEKQIVRSEMYRIEGSGNQLKLRGLTTNQDMPFKWQAAQFNFVVNDVELYERARASELKRFNDQNDEE